MSERNSTQPAEDTAENTVAVDVTFASAVQTLTDRLYADADIGPGYLLREDCEHLARRVLIALGAETTIAYGVRAENGVTGYSSEEMARAAATESGYTLGSDRSPIVAGLARSVTNFPTLTGEWRDIIAATAPTSTAGGERA